MRNLILSSILLLGLTACGGGGSNKSAPTEPLPIDINPQDIVSDAHFDFSTSKIITIDLFLEEAVGKEAHLSLCTEYTNNGNSYDVNYDSCVIRVVLDSGEFNTTIEVTNDTASVIGAVWFSDPAILPVYQVFN